MTDVSTMELESRLGDLLSMAREAMPADGKKCSQLTVDEDLALMRFYRAARPSKLIPIIEAVLASVAGRKRGDNL